MGASTDDQALRGAQFVRNLQGSVQDMLQGFRKERAERAEAERSRRQTYVSELKAQVASMSQDWREQSAALFAAEQQARQDTLSALNAAVQALKDDLIAWQVALRATRTSTAQSDADARRQGALGLQQAVAKKLGDFDQFFGALSARDRAQRQSFQDSLSAQVSSALEAAQESRVTEGAESKTERLAFWDAIAGQVTALKDAVATLEATFRQERLESAERTRAERRQFLDETSSFILALKEQVSGFEARVREARQATATQARQERSAFVQTLRQSMNATLQEYAAVFRGHGFQGQSPSSAPPGVAEVDEVPEQVQVEANEAASTNLGLASWISEVLAPTLHDGAVGDAAGELHAELHPKHRGRPARKKTRHDDSGSSETPDPPEERS